MRENRYILMDFIIDDYFGDIIISDIKHDSFDEFVRRYKLSNI